MDNDFTTPGHSWRQLYQAAMLELDGAALPRRVEQAEKALRERQEQLRTTALDGSREERCEIVDALHNLKVLRQTECMPMAGIEGQQSGLRRAMS